MNKLVITVKKEVEAETKTKQLEEQKRKIRAMLLLIKEKENSIKDSKRSIESETKEMKKLEADLAKGDFSVLGTFNEYVCLTASSGSTATYFQIS